MKSRVYIAFILVLAAATAWAQNDRKDKTAVTYEELYDEPYSVNKLFVGLQPFYGEVFATNVNAGFGIEASYYLKEKIDFRAHVRKTYSSGFFDFNRDLALKNSNVSNKPEVFNYFELGVTYHFKDFEENGQTKMILYKNSYSGGKWAARVPLHAVVPAKVRKIYGGRFGAVVWNGTADLNRVMEDQGLTNADLVTTEGIGLPLTYQDAGQTKDFRVFGNIFANSLYLGGSMAWIRNVAVSFDKYEEGVDDGMLTVFLDILYAPMLEIDPVKYQGNEHSTDAIKLSSLGGRVGIDGKFNRTLSWSYGGEVGYRPTVKGKGFYALLKVSFPVFGTNLDYKVESFGK
ncbi:MAG: hypothetical protein AB7K37_12555 [Cyclobacteriaceae bacterium]